jgi:hypothetical protein
MAHQMNVFLTNMQLYQETCSNVITKISSMPVEIAPPSLPQSVNSITASTSSSSAENKEDTVPPVVADQEVVESPLQVNKLGSEEFVTVSLSASTSENS